MRHGVVVVGSINVDLVLAVPRHPRPGETLLGDGGTLFAGGKGANQAVAAARRGAPTALVGAVGTDANAAVALRELTGAGVDLGAVATVDGPTGLAVVTLAADGENTIVVVPGANAAVTPQVVDRAAATIGAAAVVVLQAEIPTASVERAVEVAAAGGARVVLNLAPATALPLGTLVRADPLVVNEHELQLVLHSLDGHRTAADGVRDGVRDGAACGHGTSADAAVRGARRLRRHGVASVVVTLGTAGVVGVEASGEWAEPARPVHARDTTGAGDAFVGALAERLARGATLHDAAVVATRVAAYAVERLGAQASYPWRDDPLP